MLLTKNFVKALFSLTTCHPSGEKSSKSGYPVFLKRTAFCPARFHFFNLSRNESCQSVRKGDVQSSNGCDSGLLLDLEVGRRNSKYDLEHRGCCGSVYSCKSKQEWSLDAVKLPFDSNWWSRHQNCISISKHPFYYSHVQYSSDFKGKSPVFPGNL
ncbi:hypothetical protein AVEN_158015-1 [Araneus ventricosus]|uniref:Uncharacterized protein n=1 Tax=Araneus ventricosus TaxID=182803 RepID=A0A4Y2PZ36_ARAVE|nr:hypothetical protein AVEN_158015-1 [Araneus ventricosus]